MTREEIEKMEAGREMDALIAEKIFKTPDQHIYHIDYDPEGNKFADGVKESIPHYSTDIAAAWLVVEKIKDHSLDGRASYYFTVEYDRDNKNWRCGFKMMYDGFYDGYTIESTAPLAICKSALILSLTEQVS